MPSHQRVTGHKAKGLQFHKHKLHDTFFKRRRHTQLLHTARPVVVEKRAHHKVVQKSSRRMPP